MVRFVDFQTAKAMQQMLASDRQASGLPWSHIWILKFDRCRADGRLPVRPQRAALAARTEIVESDRGQIRRFFKPQKPGSRWWRQTRRRAVYLASTAVF
jgi:hypothetical protein